jgi:TolB-like protein
VLRVAAAYLVSSWLLIQVAETVFPLFGLEAAARLVVILLIIGFIPALIFAWVFEMTPGGLRRDADVPRDQRDSPQDRRRFDRLIIVILGLAVTFFAFERFVLVPGRIASELEAVRQEAGNQGLDTPVDDLSVAVLPFEDLSPSADQAWLASGIAGEILDQLAGISELRVISRSSVFALDDSSLTGPEIAERLGVGKIVEGSILSADGRIRVSVRLVEGAGGVQIWQGNFDGTLDDVIGVQDEVATAIVRELEPRLTASLPAPPDVSFEAYQDYVRARYFLEGRNPREGLALLEQVVAAEPGFADAWALLAGAYALMSPTFRLADHGGDALWAKAQAAVGQVSEIDPEHPTVLINAAFLGIQTSGDYSTAARYFERALERSTDPGMALRPAAYFAEMIGDHGWALRLLELAQRRDPLCSKCVYQYGRVLLEVGELQDVEPAIEEFLSFGSGGGELTIGTARFLAGDLDGAESTFAQRLDEPGRRYGNLLVRIGRGEADLEGEIEAFAALDSYLNPLAPAELHAQAGHLDAAFEALRGPSEAYARWELALLLRSPLLAPLHEDPRWQGMLEIAGIAPQQLAGVEFDPNIDWAGAVP